MIYGGELKMENKIIKRDQILKFLKLYKSMFIELRKAEEWLEESGIDSREWFELIDENLIRMEETINGK